MKMKKRHGNLPKDSATFINVWRDPSLWITAPNLPVHCVYC